MPFGWVRRNAVLLLVTAVVVNLCTAQVLGALGTPPRGAEQSVFSLVATPDPSPPAAEGEFAWPWPPRPPAPTIELVAMVGDPAPGLPPDFVYSDLGVPQIDAAGNLFFKAFVDGPGVTDANDLAVFYGPPSDIIKVVWESEPAISLPGAIVSYIPAGTQNVAETGLMVLTLEVSGEGITPYYNDRVIYVGTQGSFVRALQAGDQAIDCPVGTYYDGSYDDLGGQLTDNGTLFVWSALAGAGVTSSNDWGVWIGLPDDLHLVYRDYMQAAQCPEGVLYRSADLFSFNDLGQVAFRAALRGTGVTSANDGGHFMGGPATLTKISREADPAEPFGPGVTWNKVSLGCNSMNAWGDVNETAMIQGTGVTTANDQVSLIAADEGFYLLGREGTPASSVGTGVYLDYIASGYVNNLRHACFPVRYGGPGITEANQWAMYYGPYDSPVSIARDEEGAPTFPPEILLARVRDLVGFAGLNDVGDIVGPSEICGPGVTDADNVVLWLRHHVLKRWAPLLRSGDEVDGRTVYAASASDFGYSYWGATGGADGGWQSFNDAGMLAIRLEFTDGTHGIFRILPPAFGDADGDGQVGAGDLRLMERAWTGPGRGAGPERAVFDLDADGDIDLVDQALLQQLLE